MSLLISRKVNGSEREGCQCGRLTQRGRHFTALLTPQNGNQGGRRSRRITVFFQHYDPRPKSMEMHLRKLRMLQTCKKYGNILRAPEMLSKRNTLIWDLEDGLVYCRIAKVGPEKCHRLWPLRMASLGVIYSYLVESSQWPLKIETSSVASHS